MAGLPGNTPDRHGVNRHYSRSMFGATVDSIDCPDCGFSRFAWVADCPRCAARRQAPHVFEAAGWFSRQCSHTFYVNRYGSPIRCTGYAGDLIHRPQPNPAGPFARPPATGAEPEYDRKGL